MVLTLYDTGARIAALMNTAADHLDIDSGWLTIVVEVQKQKAIKSLNCTLQIERNFSAQFPNCGHGIRNAKEQFLPHAIEWVWKGYGDKKSK